MLSASRMVTVDLALLEGHLMKVANTVDLKNKTNELLRQVMNAKPSSLLIGASRWRRSPRSPKTISRTLFWSTVGRSAVCFPWKPISPAVDRDDDVTDDLRTLAERPTGAPPRVKRLTGVGNPLYRYRSGDYLVLYRIDEALVTVMRVIYGPDLGRTLRRLRG